MAGSLDGKVSRLTYQCIAQNCEKSFRGDKFKSHFEKHADLFILDQAVKMPNVMLGMYHNSELFSHSILMCDKRSSFPHHESLMLAIRIIIIASKRRRLNQYF